MKLNLIRGKMKMTEIMSGYIPNKDESGTQTAVTTTSTTAVFTGTGVIIIPQSTGIVQVSLVANLSNNTAGDGVSVNVNYAAGTALTAAGTAAAGTAALGAAPQNMISIVAGQAEQVEIDDINISGLTVGTSYTIQPVFNAITGGTASFTQVQMTAQEI